MEFKHDVVFTARHMSADGRAELIAFVGVLEYERMRSAWLVNERARKRAVAARARAARRAELAGWPDYPEGVLAVLERWVDSRPRDRRRNGRLRRITEMAVNACRRERIGGWERISARGMGKILRVKGYELVRYGDGTRVIGIADD